MGKGVIEVKVEIYNKFSYAIDLVLRKTDPDQRISTTYWIQFSGLWFFGKNGPFSDANTEFHIGGKNVGLGYILVDFVVLNHKLEVYVNYFTFLLVFYLSF